MLACVISVGVQTWGTDVVALRRYWQMADDLGYARVTYGDGLWGWTHDGWTMLGALAGLTRRTRLGPAVTSCFEPSSHHPSFGERWSRLRTLLEREGRPSWEYRRSVELDVVLGLTDAEVEDELRRLCAARAIERRDALLAAALVVIADAVAARIAQYAAAGATDLMLGFADFPATRMVEIIAERVRPSG